MILLALAYLTCGAACASFVGWSITDPTEPKSPTLDDAFTVLTTFIGWPLFLLIVGAEFVLDAVYQRRRASFYGRHP